MKRWMSIVLITALAVPVAFAQKSDKKKSGMAGCAMMQQHETMQKQMADMDAKLQSLVDDMNRAEGAAKIDKMTAVINALVAQRAMMQKPMTELQPEMMMEHMQAGKDAMSGCPMMQGDQKKPAASAPHQDH